jgi:CheY-like chemotaxis protein
MPSCLENKASKVVVVDPSGPVRQLLVETVRSGLGMASVEGKATIADALQHLEIEHADWLIVPLLADQPANALHLLQIITEHPDLKHVRVSLMVEDSERYVLPAAYELGLLSHHRRPFTKDSLAEELKSLTSKLEENKFNEAETAAGYLRSYLTEAKAHDAQVELEKGLLDVYPGKPEILINLAAPQYHLGKQEAAKQTLAQVAMLDEKLTDQAKDVGKSLFGADFALPTQVDGGGGISILGAKSAIVIDSDDTVSTAVEETLKKLGVASIAKFSDGESAFAHIEKNPEPDLIIMEWRIPKLSGPLLIQRIRHHNFLNVPVVILSSLLKPDDMPLVREMSVAGILAKPINKDLFVPNLIWTMQQERLPTEHQVMERKIGQLLAAGRKDEANPMRATFLADPNVPMARKRVVEAKFAFANQEYQLARDAAIESLKLAGDSIIVLNLLGKTFMHLKDPVSALKCFKKAQDLSPQNIERLCEIAEVQTELGDKKGAEATMEKAVDLDPDSKVVEEAAVKNAIARGDVSTAQKLMGQMDSLNDLVAYMNNKAVAYAKCGHTDEATELYRKTVQSIPEARQDTRIIVQYNLALGMARAGKIEDAAEELRAVIATAKKLKNVKISKKAQALKERIDAAIAKGTEFKLKEDAPSAPKAESAKDGKDDKGGADKGRGADSTTQLSSDDDHKRLMAQVEATRGDICCYLIFNNPSKDARVDSLLAKPPRFTRRDAIAREESMGADKLNKASA